MKREPFENMPDVMDAKQIAQALHLSKAGAYNLLNDPDFPTLQIGGRKLVMKQDLIAWLKGKTEVEQLIKEKNELYNQYQTAKDEVQRLDTIRHNLEQTLGRKIEHKREQER